MHFQGSCRFRAEISESHSSFFSPGCARTSKKHLTTRFADLNLTPRTALALKVHEPYIRHEMRSPFTPEPFSFQGSGLSEWHLVARPKFL